MSVNYLQNTKDSIACFSDGYGKDREGKFYKKALILAEGHWTDNKKRPHVFDASRLYEIAKNTNKLFQQGYKIPLLKDHQKTTDSVIGELDSPVEVREITEDDITSDRFRHLIGKLGVFAEKVLVSSQDAVQKIQENLINTISPGVDIIENCIKEISATPIPAIPGMSLFNRYSGASEFNNNYDPTYFSSNEDELEWEEEDNHKEKEYVFTEFKIGFEKINHKYLKLVYNIIKAPPERLEIRGVTRLELMEDALDNYIYELENLVYGDEEDVNEMVHSLCSLNSFI